MPTKDVYKRQVLGLELGADDYMLKPFDTKELVARVKAVLRRYQPVSYTHLSIEFLATASLLLSCTDTLARKTIKLNGFVI